MFLIDYIQKIQNKPRCVRIKYLWASVSICMLLVISIWTFSLKHSLSLEEGKNSAIINDENVSLKKAFEANIGAFFEGKSESIDNKKEIETEIINNIETEKETERVKPARLPISK